MMIRLTACQLCLLQRSATPSLSSRPFSLSKGKCRNNAFPALKQVEEIIGQEEEVVQSAVVDAKRISTAVTSIQGGNQFGVIKQWYQNRINPSSCSGVTVTGGILTQISRGFWGREGTIKWRRRRRKEMEERLKVLNPSSPVIDAKFPLPPDNLSKVPPGLFDGQQKKNPVKEEAEQKGVLAEINRQIDENDTGRLFAVIALKGKQFKVTAEDILIVQGYWAPNVGDRLRLHKILLCGSKDFTLIGKPLLDSNIIRVEGTVIEKTLSYLKLHFRLKKRKNFRRMKFQKDPYTMLRINMVEVLEPLAALDESKLPSDETADAEFKEAIRN